MKFSLQNISQYLPKYNQASQVHGPMPPPQVHGPMPPPQVHGPAIPSQAPKPVSAPPRSLATWKYDDDATVYRSDNNQAFTNPQDFLNAGGNWNTIEVRKRQAPQTPQALQFTPEQISSALYVAANTPPPTATPPPQPSQPPPSLSAAEQALLANQGPSSEEISLNQQLAQLTANSELGKAGIYDKPIPMPFITGQAASLERRTALAALPLQARLAAEQSRRQASLDVAKTRYQIEKDKYDRERQTRLDEQTAVEQSLKNIQTQQSIGLRDPSKPFYFVGSEVRRKSDNKRYSTPEQAFADGVARDFSNVEQVSAKPIEMSEGQSLVDPVTGKIISTIPKTYKPGEVTPQDEIAQWADDVFTGKATLASVPNRIQPQVSQAVNQRRNSKYTSEFEARVDYDAELQQLQQNISSFSGKPSDLINDLVSEYGKYISKQEIEGTIKNILGLKVSSTGTGHSSATAATRKFVARETFSPIHKIPLTTTYLPIGRYATSKPSPNGIVGEFTEGGKRMAYDISSYASDPNHEMKVTSIFNKIPPETRTSASAIDSYIKSHSLGKKSPVTGQMVLNAANKYNVHPRMIMAMMQADSNFGVAGKATWTKNPGNVGHFDDGRNNPMNSWQDGVNAVAANLAERKVIILGHGG